MAVAKQKRKENERFYVFLKGIDIPDEKIDLMVQDLYRKYASETNCKICRNCCKRSGPVLSRENITTLARKKNMTTTALVTTYLKPNTEEAGTYTVKNLPCPFLATGECIFNDSKPEGCRDYPYLLKEKFTYRLHDVFENYEICPIVFNVVETLKHLIWNRT